MSEPAPLFRLDGKPILGTRPASWKLTSGVQPYMAEFDFIPGDADDLLTGNLRPLELEIVADGKSKTFSALYALHSVPGDVPESKVTRVVVADRRWFWTHKIIKRSYNIRRRVGFKRVLQDGSRETSEVVESLWYAPWSSRNDSEPFTAEEILRDVFAEVFIAETEFGGSSSNFLIEDDALAVLGFGQSQLPVEDFELFDRGDLAVQRLLNYLPQTGVYVDAAGTVRVYSKASGGENVQTAGFSPEVGAGVIEKVDLRRIRPREIHVLFQREIEVRFDTVELEVGATSDQFGGTRMFMENVLPSPDFQLTLTNGSDITRGTWITFSEAMRAWGTHPSTGHELTFDLIQRAAVPFLSLFASLKEAGKRDPDNDWASRIAAIERNYRRTYRINRRWMDAIQQLLPYRVSIVEPVRGTRAPAIAYGNHAFVPGMRTLFTQASGDSDLSFAINVTGFEDPGTPARLGPGDKPAAKVNIVDHDQGIIEIDWQVDPSRPFAAVLPSWVEDGNGGTGDTIKPELPGPTGDLTDRSRSISFDSVPEVGSRGPKLSAEHRASVILTAIPGSPNGNGQFQRVKVRPEELGDLLPEGVRGGRFDGPIMEVHVGPQLPGARAFVAWSDDDRETIEGVFGVGPQIVLDTSEALADLILNYEGNVNGRGSLASVARAASARIWASLADRRQGSKTTPVVPNAHPAGWLDSVDFTVSPRGVAESTFSLPGRIPEIDINAWLPASTRALLNRLVTASKV